MERGRPEFASSVSTVSIDYTAPQTVTVNKPNVHSTISPSQTNGTSVKAKSRRKHFNLFLLLSEPQLLEVFSFLQTMEVVNSAQVCRAVFARVDSLFGMESAVVVRPDWEKEAIEMQREMDSTKEKHTDTSTTLLPALASVSSSEKNAGPSSSNPQLRSPAPSAVSASQVTLSGPTPLQLFSPSDPNSTSSGGSAAGANSAAAKLSREMVEALTKKLTPQELKYVLSISEQLKKRQQQIDSLEMDKTKLQDRWPLRFPSKIYRF